MGKIHRETLLVDNIVHIYSYHIACSFQLIMKILSHFMFKMLHNRQSNQQSHYVISLFCSEAVCVVGWPRTITDGIQRLFKYKVFIEWEIQTSSKPECSRGLGLSLFCNTMAMPFMSEHFSGPVDFLFCSQKVHLYELRMRFLRLRMVR